MQEAVVGASRSVLWVLMCAVLGLMLIACLNLANSQIGRAISRRREAAVRAALGASARSLLWSGLAENLLLAVAGGALGIGFAFAGLDLFRRFSPIDLPRLAEVHPDSTVLIFAIVLTRASSILSGLVPALRFLRADPQLALQQSGNRASGSRQSRGARAWLIGVQVFGCTALLLITGLFSKSLLSLLRQDRGFETSHVVVADVRLTYREDASRTAFDDAVLANLRAIPGVEAAGLGSAMPLEGETWIEGVQRQDGPKRQTLINLRWASPGYFETLKERLVSGRFLEERDRNLNNIVISESLAKALWPNENPIGGVLRDLGPKKDFTVVGVVADSRSTSLKTAPPRMAYVHYGYRPPFNTLFLSRSSGAADGLVPQMRQAIWKYAPGVTIARVKTLESQVTDSLATERLQTAVLVAFGAAALLLALLGIYGVLSYSVVARKQEIGIRMALGATRGRIYGLTLWEAGTPVFAGLAAGLLAGFLAGRVIRSLLYGTEPQDPLVMLIVAALFLASAGAAALLPARRAASIAPMETLRTE
jgi:predicted permease